MTTPLEEEKTFPVSKEELATIRTSLAESFPSDDSYLSDDYILSVASKPYSKDPTIRRPIEYSTSKLNDLLTWRLKKNRAKITKEGMLRYLNFHTNYRGSSAFDGEKEQERYSHKIDAYYGQRVDWLDGRHYGANELETYRLIGDIEIDRILDLASGERSDISGKFANTIEACRKIYIEHQDGEKEEGDLSLKHQGMCDFYRHYHDQLPSWIDWEQIQRGIDVYITYAPVATQSLYYLSLLPGFAIPKIGKVLEQTRYLVPPSTPRQVRTRLLDTGGFITGILLPTKNGLCASSLRPGSKGWVMALQVRVLHAKVRRSILCNERIQWDTEKYGVPINQEDMAATLLAFSVNVLNGIQFISGREISLEAQRDYLALWRYIGWLLGVECDERETDFQSFPLETNSGHVPLDPCGTRINGRIKDNSVIHARASLESILIHLMHPNNSSSNIAKHLLSTGGSLIEDNKQNGNRKKIAEDSLIFLYRSYMCRLFIGDSLANSIKLPAPKFRLKSISAYTLTIMVLAIFRMYTLLTMSISWFRKIAYSLHLKLIERFAIDWGEENHHRVQDEAAKFSRKEPSCPFSLVMPPKAADI